MDSHSKFAILAVLAMALVAFVPIMAEASDATGEPDLSIYRYTPKLTMTSDNFGAVKYIVWDFGDGTVLDGRWEYYVEKQDNGETLSADIIAGINAYKALLAENGNSLIVTTHTYALKGTYTATAVAMNPLGYVPEGGTAYDGILSQDATGYNGGIDNPASMNITTPTDEVMDSAEFKAFAGSWCRVNYVVEVKGYPTITFDTKGGSTIAPMEVQNTSEYTAATMPANPTKEGFAFNGWFTDDACTQAYDWTQKVMAPITLYAGWTSSTEPQYDHIITYKDGTTVLGTQNTRNGTNGNVSVAITQDNPSKEGKVFMGWVANEGDAPVLKGASVSVPVGGLVLNAVWGEPTTTFSHTIHYIANGGTGSMDDTMILDNVSGSTPMVLANNGFSKEGYLFKGWLVGTELKQPGAQIQVPGNQTVNATAQWEASATPVTTITVYVDGHATTFNQGQTIADIVKPAQTGYRFDGWFAESDFRNQLAETTVLTNNLYVFSKLSRIQDDPTPSTTVTVKVDGIDKVFTQGKKVADVAKPVREGYTFAGWYTDAAFNNAVSESVVLTNGMTLYSKMTENTEPEEPAQDDNDMIVYAIIIVGAILAIIGLFVHPVLLIAGIAVAAFGGLEFFDIINLL